MSLDNHYVDPGHIHLFTVNSLVTPLDVINKVASTCCEGGQLYGPLCAHSYSVKANQKSDTMLLFFIKHMALICSENCIENTGTSSADICTL